MKLDRKIMPQVDGDDLQRARKILSNSGVGSEFKMIPPTNLSHSQSAVDRTKVSDIISDIKSGKKMPPIVISSDNFIIDGHHRHIAYQTISPSDPIRTLQIDLPQKLALVVWKKIEKMV